MNIIKKKLVIAFWGTPDLCIPILEKLKENGYMPSIIITAPDRPVGRKQVMTSSPVKIWAEKNNIIVLRPEKLNKEFEDKINEYKIDLSLVVAYGKILSKDIIELPQYGTLNLHYSLLPKYRGASPVESAILNNEKRTGVCIQKMKYKLDAGDILKCKEVLIEKNETALDLRKKLNDIGSELIIQLIPLWINGDIKLIKQNENEATYTKKIKKEDGEVDINNLSSEELYCRYKAYFGWPGIFFFDTDINGNKIRIKITEAIYENDKFIIKKIIPEGKKEIEYKKYYKL